MSQIAKYLLNNFNSFSLNEFSQKINLSLFLRDAIKE